MKRYHQNEIDDLLTDIDKLRKVIVRLPRKKNMKSDYKRFLRQFESAETGDTGRKVIGGGFKIPYAKGDKTIEYDKLIKGMVGSINDIQKPAGALLTGMPLQGLAFLGESILLKILPVFGSLGGPIVGMLFSSLFSYLNGLFSSDKPSIEAELRRITGEMIDSNNYEIMRLKTQGINDVYADFMKHLDLYMETRNDSRDQVLNKFDAFTAVARAELPTLSTLSNGIGMPLYMQAVSLILVAYRELLFRRVELKLDDKYVQTNLRVGLEYAQAWTTKSQEVIREQFNKKSGSFVEASTYLRGIYTGGYAMLLAAYRSFYSLQYGVMLEHRNSAELYVTSLGQDWSGTVSRFNRDILSRKSMLMSLYMVGHKDNVLAISQDYINGIGDRNTLYGESCYSPMGATAAYKVSRDFKINPFTDTDIDGGRIANTYIANTPYIISGQQKVTYLLGLDTPSGYLQAGVGNTDGLYNVNVPFYCFSGYAFDEHHKGVTCAANAGWGFETHGGIFRYYEGVDTKVTLAVEGGDLTPGVCYDLDLNTGCMSTEAQGGYSDILLGKNVMHHTNYFTTKFTLFLEKAARLEPGHFRVLIFAAVGSTLSSLKLYHQGVVFAEENNISLGEPLYTLSSLNGTQFGMYEVILYIRSEKVVDYSLDLHVTLKGALAGVSLISPFQRNGNMVKNGDFSKELAEWYVFNAGNTTSVAIVTDEGSNACYIGSVSSPSYGVAFIQQRMTVEPNSFYRGRMMVKTRSRGNIRISISSQSDKSGLMHYENVFAQNDYTPVNFTFFTVDKADAYITIENDSRDAGGGYIKEVSIRKV
jgi:hypothetical protein